MQINAHLNNNNFKITKQVITEYKTILTILTILNLKAKIYSFTL